MAVDSVLPSTLTDYVSNTPVKQTGQSSLGKDDFMKLLFAQMKNQDPQNPMDDREMAAQLAQFSSLEQMTNVNTNITALKTTMENQGKFAYLGAVGKTARVAGDAMVTDSTGAQQGIFKIDSDAANVNVAIASSTGTVIRTISMGAAAAGEYTFQWDGKLASGSAAPTDQYHFSVQATDANSKTLASTSYVEGKITGISLNDNPPKAYIGDYGVPFDQILQIKGG